MTFFLAILWVFVSDRRILYLVALCLSMTAVATVSATYDWMRFDLTTYGVITEEVIARKGDSESYKEAFHEPLQEGQEFKVLKKRDEWIFVSLPGGHEGWIPENSSVLY